MAQRSLWLLVAALGTACGGTIETTDGSPPGVDGGRVDGGGGCLSAATCRPGEVCNPTTHECVTDLPCTTNDDCGAAAFCNGGTCAINMTGGPCSSDMSCLPGEHCIGGLCGCMGENYGADSVPPNMLIVLDRSDSMNTAIGAQTKWEIALSAIGTMLTTYGDRVRFGLALYPGANEDCSTGAQCTAGHVFVDPGDGTAGMINGVLGRASTCMFGTPTGEELTSLVGYTGLADTTRPNYVLLITDGQHTQACSDPVAAVTSLRGETPEVRTFVIGFGGEVDPTELTDMANAGGTARTGDPVYYQADDATGLAGAFSSIAGSVLSCTYTLSGSPSDLAMLYVYFDRRPIARDTTHNGGWDYDAAMNQLTFYGGDCNTLRDGGVASLVIVYGCPIF